MKLSTQEWVKEVDCQTLPNISALARLYAGAVALTRRHGFHTLGRINASVFRRGAVVRLPTGVLFALPPDPHFFGYIVGHEPHITQVITQVVQAGDFCVDVGANIGYFALMMAACCGDAGLVLAFEPERTNFEVLALNSRFASAQGLKVAVEDSAISDEASPLILIRGPFSTYHKVQKADPPESGREYVRSTVLSRKLIEEYPGRLVKLLKIDVEGHELQVLRGCRRALAERRILNIVVEVANGSPYLEEIDEIIQPKINDSKAFIGGKWQTLHTFTSLVGQTDVWTAFSHE